MSAPRPMPLPELLDRFFGLYKKHFGILFLSSVSYTLLAFIPAWLARDAQIAIMAHSSMGKPPTWALLSSHLVNLALAGILGIVSFFVILVVMGMQTWLFHDAFMGYEIKTRDLVNRGVQSILYTLVGVLWNGILGSLGFIACCVGVVFSATKMFIVTPAAILEKSPIDSIKRSWELTEGYFSDTLILWLLSIIIPMITAGATAAAGVIPAMLKGVTSNNPADFIMPLWVQLLVQIVAAFSYPIATGLNTLHYLNLRIRKEGYDVQSMAAQIGMPVPPPGLS